MSGPRFSIIPAWIITDGRLKGSDLRVLCLLGTYTNKEGWCRRSQVKMAEQLGCGRSTVQDSLKRLGEIGVVERQEVASADGRDSAHWYRVVLDRVVDSNAFAAWDDEDEKEFGPIDGIEKGTPPAGIPAPPAGPRPAPPAGSGPAPINDSNLTPPVERTEREREREDGEGEENPRAIERRFRAWFAKMPGYLDDSEPNARREWNALTAAQRAECESMTPVWLEERKKLGRTKAVAASTYLTERRWERLPEQARAAHEKAKAQEERVTVAPYGHIWSAMRMLSLLDGPKPIDLPDDLIPLTVRKFEIYRRTSESTAMAFLAERGIRIDGKDLIFPDDFRQQEYRRRVQQEGYPEAVRFNRMAIDRTKDHVDKRFSALAALCEFVPLGSPTFERWRDYHEQMHWPPVPEPDPKHLAGVWFPKGGPEGLGEFEMAARAALGMERGYDDAE